MRENLTKNAIYIVIIVTNTENKYSMKICIDFLDVM